MLREEELCLQAIIETAEKKGFITNDEILELEESYGVSFQGVDRIARKIDLYDILVCDDESEHPLLSDNDLWKDDNSFEDHSYVDYDQVYKEIEEKTKNYNNLLTEVRNCPPPQRGEVKKLVIQIKEGNEYARERLIKIYLRTAIRIALSASKLYDLDIEEAIPSSFVGLIEGIYKYIDTNTVAPFVSYISFPILRRIQSDCKCPNMLNNPMHVTEQIRGILRIDRWHHCSLCSPHYICPNLLTEVMETLKLSENEARERLELFFSCRVKMTRISRAFKDSREEYYCHDFKQSRTYFLDVPVMNHAVYEAMQVLSERQLKIINLRYGLKSKRVHTLEELAQHYNVTRERIRQLEFSGLKKMRRAITDKLGHALIDFDDIFQ